MQLVHLLVYNTQQFCCVYPRMYAY